ncbi:MAG TPA: serine hydrolase domain-containing protein [Chloroflexota bacterium]
MKTTRIAVAVLSFTAAGIAAHTPEGASAHPVYGHTTSQSRQVAAGRLDAAASHAARNLHFSGVVLVLQAGTVVLRKVYGPSDRTNSINTAFALPGVTDLLTAAAIEQLAEHGKVDLGVRSTVRARHDASTERAAITLIERVSGESYATYMERNMFRPLGMNHTSVRQSSTGLPEVYATVDDLNRWDQSVLDCGLISPESLFKTVSNDSEVFQASGTDKGAAAGERLFLNSRTAIIVLTHSGKTVDHMLNALQHIAVPDKHTAIGTTVL